MLAIIEYALCYLGLGTEPFQQQLTAFYTTITTKTWTLKRFTAGQNPRVIANEPIVIALHIEISKHVTFG